MPHLSALQPPISSRNHCRPSPCDRLSRPRTTTTAPPRPWPIGRRCAQPLWPRWRRGQGGRSRTVPVFTCRSLDGGGRGGTRLGPCDIAVATPQHLHHGLPIGPPTFRGVPRLRDEGGGCASRPAQIRQVRAGASLRSVERRFLAYAFPRRSPHPRRLAVPTRHGFVGAACHPSRHLPRQAAPSFTAPLRRDGGEGLSPPTQSTSASRRTGGMTQVPKRSTCGNVVRLKVGCGMTERWD